MLEYHGGGRFSTGRWEKEEHAKFVEALKVHGKDWGKVQRFVGTRSSTQARSHAQKFFQKVEKYLRNNGDIIDYLKEADIDDKRVYDFEDSASANEE
jgi:SHAQKYF class myb-like DNA-binding protein